MGIETDLQKAIEGNKAAGRRARAGLLLIKNQTGELRKSVLELRG